MIDPASYGVTYGGSVDEVSNLQSAATAAAAASTGLIINGKVRIASGYGTLSVPVQFSEDGAFDFRSGGSMTISGHIDAPARQIFIFNGTVTQTISGVEYIGPDIPTITGVTEEVYVQWFGAKNNNDDTSSITTNAFKLALNSCPGRIVRVPKGRYKVSSTVQINVTNVHMRGDFGGRGDPNTSTENGTEISYVGTGACLQIGSDNGSAWDANEYDGLQSHLIEDIHFRHGNASDALTINTDVTQWATSTAYSLHAYVRTTSHFYRCTVAGTSSGAGSGPTHTSGTATDGTVTWQYVGNTVSTYKSGSYGIRDWRGGQVKLKNVGFEKFDYSFWGIQSDINEFDGVFQTYSRYGIYIGPRSDQFTIRNFYSFFCDTAITIDRARHVTISDSEFVGCGTSTKYAIDIYKGSAAVRILACWFEHLQGYPKQDQVAFVGAGITDGYNSTTSSASEITLENCLVYTTISDSDFHTRFVVNIGAALGVRLISPVMPVGSSLTNFDSLIQAYGSYDNTQATCSVYNVLSSLSVSDMFSAAGGSTADFSAFVDGASGTKIYVTSGRLSICDPNAATGAEELRVSTEGQAGQVHLVTPSYASGQTTRFKLTRAMHTGGAAPTSGAWQQGDIVWNLGANAGGKAGWICTTGGDFAGTPPVFKAFGAIDA